MSDGYMTITLPQPWAEFAVSGICTTLNSRFNSTHRGILLIHAGRKKNFDKHWRDSSLSARALELAKSHIRRRVMATEGHFAYQFEKIVGAVLMLDATDFYTDSWSIPGFNHFAIAPGCRFHDPIARRGRMRIYMTSPVLSGRDRVSLEALSGRWTKIEATSGSSVSLGPRSGKPRKKRDLFTLPGR